jgi:hypothetical protein
MRTWFSNHIVMNLSNAFPGTYAVVATLAQARRGKKRITQICTTKEKRPLKMDKLEQQLRFHGGNVAESSRNGSAEPHSLCFEVVWSSESGLGVFLVLSHEPNLSASAASRGYSHFPVHLVPLHIPRHDRSFLVDVYFY